MAAPGGSRRSRLKVRRLLRMAPKMATPNEAPIERLNVSTPVAVPRSRCSTEFWTARTMTWMIMPRPRPRTTM